MKRHTGDTDMQQFLATWRGCQHNPGTGSLADPFAVNPIRRSFALVAGCLFALVAPWMIGDEAASAAMLSVTWLAITGLVFGLPVLVLSLIEAAVLFLRALLRPSIDELPLTPRVKHVLARHGYNTIEDLEVESDEALLMLSNLNAGGVREIRRAVALRNYRRWQERGFPNVSR